MPEYYVLVDRHPVKVEHDEWMHWEIGNRRAIDAGEEDARRVGETRFADEAWVSTVFLFLDHRWGDGGPPLVFETMIFDGADEEWCQRASTWDEALVVHRQAVAVAAQTHGTPTESKLIGVLTPDA